MQWYPVRKLADVKGLSEVKVNKILEVVKALFPMGFSTGTDLAKVREMVLRISTGSTELDTILQGASRSRCCACGFLIDRGGMVGQQRHECTL